MANTFSGNFVSASSQNLTDTSSAVCQPSSLTIEAWIKPVAVNVRNDIVIKDRTGGSAAYLFTVGVTSGKLSATFQAPASVNIDSISSITPGVWTHVAITYDGTTAKLYINGNSTPDNTATLSQAISYAGSFPLCIGGNGQYFNGNIDEVRVWNTIRTGAQINANYGIQLVGNEAGLVSYWKLDNSLLDSTANANNLTNHNVVTFVASIPFVTNVSTDNRYWIGGTGSWGTVASANWTVSSGGTGGVFSPISTNPVFLDGNSWSGTVTLGSTGNCNDLTFTGYTGTFAGSNALNIYGSLVLASGMTLSYTGTITFASTSTGKTITTAGKTILSTLTFNGVGGSWTLQDALTVTGASITLTNGSLSLNNLNVSLPVFNSSNSNTRVLTMGSGTLSLTGTGTVWNVATSTGMTFNKNTSVIKFTNTSSSSKTFSGGGITYYNLYLTGSGTGVYIIEGSNTFNDFKVDTPPHTVNFTAGTTQTVTSFSVNGTAGNLMTLQSTSAGTRWNIASASVIVCDYLSLQDSNALSI